jgi:hypothetical protein
VRTAALPHPNGFDLFLLTSRDIIRCNVISEINLEEQTTGGGEILRLEDGTRRLHIPAGGKEAYRLAQLDDYSHLSRRHFPHAAPFSLRLEARVSSVGIPGTWGFGLWNDPFSMGSFQAGAGRLLPTLPQAAWFFYASPPNYLSLRDDRPAEGFLMATFQSRRLPALLLAPAVLGLPLLAWRWAARRLRRLGRLFVRQDACLLEQDPTQWHSYGLDWEDGKVFFTVDGEELFQTGLAPQGRLGLVIWIDNQFAAFRPEGTIHYGRLPYDLPARLDVCGISLSTG